MDPTINETGVASSRPPIFSSPIIDKLRTGGVTAERFLHEGRDVTLVTPGLFPLVGVSKPMMAKIGFAMLYEPHQRFDIPLDAADLFTTVPSWQTFINEDPLTLRQCTAGFYLASRRMDKPIGRLVKCEPVPVHLFLAGDERIVDNTQTEAFVRGLGWAGLRVTSYETARHSLEFENDPTVYFGALREFFDEADAGRV